jgi:hypothetical protein
VEAQWPPDLLGVLVLEGIGERESRRAGE